MTPTPGGVLLFSGGLDSLAAWWLLGQPRAVYVRWGAPYEQRELDAIARLADRLPGLRVEVASGPRLVPWPDGHVPHRNLMLAAVAAAATDPPAVWLAAVRGEPSPDKTRRFLRHASRALTAGRGQRVRVEAPVRHLTKRQLALAALAGGLPVDAAAASVSCYAGGPGGCGMCQACFRRLVALRGTPVPLRFDADPRTWARGKAAASWRHFGRVPVTEWPGVVRAQADAALALMR